MKTKLITTLSIMLILFTACNENRIFEQHKGGFGSYRWKKSKSVNFKPAISNTDDKHIIYIALRHVYGFQFKSLKVKMEIISPSGKKLSKSYDLQVFKNNSEYFSECAVDYCDLEVPVEKNYQFSEIGNYQFIISHEMDVDPIPNVMEIGLIIDKLVVE